MISSDKNSDFEIWFDDSKTEMIGKVEKLPPLPPEEKHKIKNTLTELVLENLSNNTARIAV